MDLLKNAIPSEFSEGVSLRHSSPGRPAFAALGDDGGRLGRSSLDTLSET